MAPCEAANVGTWAELEAPGSLIQSRSDRDEHVTIHLEELFEAININSLIFARPAEPYASIIQSLCREGIEAIKPSDSETRTFLHDLPVVRRFDIGEAGGEVYT